MWTTEMIDLLKTLHAQGLSFSVIAARLGVTRNAAIGKANREKLPPRSQIEKPIVNVRRKIRLARKGDSSPKRAKAGGAVSLTVPPPPSDCRNLTLLELKNDRSQCRYPTGHFTFCGLPTVTLPSGAGRYSWCEHHLEVVSAKQ